MGNLDKGWIKLSRGMLDHWLWKEKPFDKKSAWIDILLMTNHQDAKYMVKGKLVEVKRGQCGTSVIKLAARWGWSRNKVRNFLLALESDGMLTVKGTAQGTTLTVINYEVFQNREPTKRTPKGQQTDQQKDITRDTNKNGKRMKKKEKEKDLPSGGETVGIDIPDEEWVEA